MDNIVNKSPALDESSPLARRALIVSQANSTIVKHSSKIYRLENMSNSNSVGGTELDPNSDHKTGQLITNEGTPNITTDSVTRSEYENSRAQSQKSLASSSINSTDSVIRSEYEHTYVHSLKTLAYLAWVGWPRPRDPRDCDCGCIVDGIRMAKPHFRARRLSQTRYPYQS